MAERVTTDMKGRVSSMRALRGSLALAVVLATASVASAGSVGYGGFEIRIDPSGISPAVVQLKASSSIPFWVNYDSAPHTLTFEDGQCTFTIATGGRDHAPCHHMLLYAGSYPYRVDDTLEAAGKVVVMPNRRWVTLVTSRVSVRSGQAVTFSGTVFAESVAPFGGFQPQQITLFRRGEKSRRFRPIQRAVSKFHPSPCGCDVWSVTIRPTATASYIARIVNRPEQVVWEEAESSRVVVRVKTARSGH